MVKLENHDMQGLIMSGYGHLGHAAYLFFTFRNAQAGRNWLDSLIERVATGERWPTDENGRTIKPDHAINIGLTYFGLRALRLPEDSLASFPHEFQQGMAHEHRSRILDDIEDSAPENWQFGGIYAGENKEQLLHGIVVILADSEEHRDSLSTEIKNTFDESNIELMYEQIADKLANDREHFGFFDGISQPRIEGGVRDPKTDEPTIRAGEFVLGYENEYDQIPWSPQLNGTDLGRNGSYLVVRKLHQDVAAFWRFIAANREASEDIGALHNATESERDVWLASKFVGRWPSGCPLVMAPYRDDPTIPFEEFNRFYFNNRDPHGEKCPFGSHVRRTNPRDSLPPNPKESLKFADRHLIIRRGMPYGEPLFPLMELPPNPDIEDDGAERGLMFLCINANIARQFEFVQQTWVENTKFHGLYNDKDPLVGGCDEKTDHTIQHVPVRRKVKNLPRLVHMKGGGYFFLPSITALKRIAALQ